MVVVKVAEVGVVVVLVKFWQGTIVIIESIPCSRNMIMMWQ